MIAQKPPGPNGSAGRGPVAGAALLLAAGHSALQGVEVWLQPATWPGGMPPLTLIGFLAAVATAAIALRGAPRSPR